MKVVRQFALMVAVLLPLVAPTMACAAPSAHLSPAERACCKQMKGDCGGMSMPTSQRCCDKQVPTADHWNAAILMQSATVPMNGAGIAGPTSAAVFPLPVSASDFAHAARSTLPQSPPPAISVLRI